MTQTTTPDDEYGWINSIFDATRIDYEGVYEAKAKQQIISHIRKNYTPNSEVERVKRELLYDLDEIDNKPWRVFRQLASIIPEYSDIYTDYEAFYAYGGSHEVQKLIDKFKKTNDYKESGYPDKRELLSNKGNK